MVNDVEELLAWLPTIALFGGLEASSLRRVIGMMGEHAFGAGDEVCRQGHTGRALFLIRSGEVMVCRDSPDGHRVKVVRLGSGDFFGEMTIIDVQRRSATVVVQQPSVLLSLDNRDLYRLYQADVPAYVMILQNLCRELSRRLRASNERLQSLAEETDGSERTLIRAKPG